MPRRIDAGPALAALGASLLLVALFLDWFGGARAWTVFEVLDLVLAGLAIAALVAALSARLDARWLPVLGAIAFVAVAAQLIDPPPAARSDDRDPGAWLALAGAALLLAGGLLRTASFAVHVEVRDTASVRRRVPAVDRRETPVGGPERPAAPVAGPAPVVAGDPAEEPTRVAAVDRRPEAEEPLGSRSLFAPVPDDPSATRPFRPVEDPDR